MNVKIVDQQDNMKILIRLKAKRRNIAYQALLSANGV